MSTIHDESFERSWRGRIRLSPALPVIAALPKRKGR